jgi:DNA uptake protein ComE-like DNA-binding protein
MHMRSRALLLAAAVVYCVWAGSEPRGIGEAQAAGQGNPQVKAQVKAQARAIPPPEARVDINHASADELMKIPGMTQTWAARIVRFRPYRTKQDLVDKGVLTSEVYDRIKDCVIAHREKQ